MKAELVPTNGDPPLPIVKDVTVVGRHRCCDLQIDRNSLSKRHCVLVRTDGLLVVRDLATTNGTKVNGQRIRWAALLPNDKITLGGYKCRVYLGPDDAPAPSERQGQRHARVNAPPAEMGSPLVASQDVGFPPPSSPDVIPLSDADLLDDETEPPRTSPPKMALIDDSEGDSGEFPLILLD